MRSLDAADLPSSPVLRDPSRRYQGLTYNCVSAPTLLTPMTLPPLLTPISLPPPAMPPRRVDSAVDMRSDVTASNTGGNGQPASNTGGNGQQASNTGGNGQPASNTGGTGQPASNTGGTGQASNAPSA